MQCCGRNAWNRFNRRQRRKHIKTSPLQQVIKKQKHVSYQRMIMKRHPNYFLIFKMTKNDSEWGKWKKGTLTWKAKKWRGTRIGCSQRCCSGW